MTLKQVRIEAAEGLLERTKDTAWKRRVSLSELVRKGLVRYAKTGEKGAGLSRKDPGAGRERIRIWVDEQTWDAVIEHAVEEGVSTASVVRRIMQRANEQEKP